jgi:flagellar biogenesis protein FliO
MFDGRNQNFTRSRLGFPDLNSLSDVIGRWLPFAGRRSRLGTAVQHLGTLPLTTQSSLALVRVYKETLVLGITPQSVTLLAKADADNPPMEPANTDAAPTPAEGENLGSIANVSQGGKSHNS